MDKTIHLNVTLSRYIFLCVSHVSSLLDPNKVEKAAVDALALTRAFTTSEFLSLSSGPLSRRTGSQEEWRHREAVVLAEGWKGESWINRTTSSLTPDRLK